MSSNPQDPFKAFDITSVVGTSTPTSHSQIIENLLSLSPTGNTNTIVGDNFYGINHRKLAPAIPINRDYFGLVFFTRPRMNLTTENLQRVRKMIPLLSSQDTSIQRILRCYLDPQLGYGIGTNQIIQTSMVDNQCAFIPMLTNQALTVSGWPDLTLPTFTSVEGIQKEVFGIGDGVTDFNGEFVLTATFRNQPGDPITLLFFYWLHYISLVHEGVIVPYPDMIIENEIDYQTRIYRLVLDATKTKVQGIAITGASIPVSDPTGAKFNYEHDSPLNRSNDQVSITFNCYGVQYYDDILIDEFNRTVQTFNNSMRDQTRETSNKLLKLSELQLFNYRGYPRINPNTYDLEWWVPNNDYNNMVSVLNNSNSTNPFTTGKNVWSQTGVGATTNTTTPANTSTISTPTTAPKITT